MTLDVPEFSDKYARVADASGETGGPFPLLRENPPQSLPTFHRFHQKAADPAVFATMIC